MVNSIIKTVILVLAAVSVSACVENSYYSQQSVPHRHQHYQSRQQVASAYTSSQQSDEFAPPSTTSSRYPDARLPPSSYSSSANGGR